MAKAVRKKKVNRKMKRSIRKTFSAVLMITAIVVAMIPVPENIASDGATATPVAAPAKLTYPTAPREETISNKINGKEMNLDPASVTTKQQSLTVRQGSDGKWQLNWQFEFYEDSTTHQGVISLYNSQYSAENVTLNPNINMGYEVIDETTYTAYYTGLDNDVEWEGVYTLNYEQYNNGTLGDVTKDFYNKYVPGAYEKFAKECDEYTAKKAAWDALPPDEQLTTPEPVKPVDVKKYINDNGSNAGLTNEQKLQYYCDKNSFESATLVEVYDKRTPGTANPIVYMPKGGDNPDKYDNNGFWYDKDNTASVIAIGNNAFAGTQNVNVLNLPSEIKFIGDDAFNDSFIQEVTFDNVENIGHRAFKNCTRLHTVTFKQGLVVIGTEAFNTTALTAVEFPASTKTIAPGAFAKCTDLQTIDLQQMGNPEGEIGEYAFYDCTALNAINFGNCKIHTIGDAAFAIVSGQKGTLDTFAFPSTISAEAEFGDCILAGRGMMKKVVMPADFGRSAEVTVPKDTFYGCINLEEVEFPADGAGSCGLATYDEKMFSTVVKDGFFVRGPELDRNGQIATPRKATWHAKTTVSDYVPYVYTKNGVDYYEISDGKYLLAGNANGELTSCTLINRDEEGPIELVIPSQVGGYDIKTLANNCIGDDVKKIMKTLTVEDNSLTTIADGVFKECPILESVKIGNSVQAIGTGAFENCPKLIDVTFNTPLNNDYARFAIGENAFATGSDELTFRGDIVAGYAPFEWAMAEDNLIDELSGKRVCYKSIEPTHMAVMRDNETGEVTLLDYPKLLNLDRDNAEYCDTMTTYFKAKYPEGSVSGSGVSSVSGGSVSGGDPQWPWESTWKYSILDNYTLEGDAQYEWQTISPREQKMIDATRNIVVPEGVTSIDVAGYLKSSKNNVNIITYLTKSSDYNVDMYRNTKTEGDETVIPGLFSGYFEDFAGILPEEAAQFEKLKKGNDSVLSVKLTSVKKLPEYAFDNCEQLNSVDLGVCTDIGTAPFRGCDSMTAVGGNDKYSCENGIIYSVDNDGTLKIEECLTSRGKLVGESYVNATSDPKITQVGHIADGAFEDCNYLVRAYFNDSPKLKTIPKYCFRNCERLTEVVLPESVNEIQEKAFAGDNPLFMTIYGKEVSIRDDAFEHDPAIEIRSYEDSAAITYAKTYGLTPVIIEKGFKIDFLDYDGTFLTDTQYIQKGGAAVVPDDPVRDGWSFTGWSCTVPNMSAKNITSDATFIAQYKEKTNGGNGGGGNNNNGNNNGNNNNNNNNNNNGTSGNGTNSNVNTVTVINGSGSGTYTKGTTVSITANAPATGKKFDRWETNSLNVTMANATKDKTTFKMPGNNVVVTAVYDSKDGSGSGSGGSTSSTTTTTKNNSSTASGDNGYGTNNGNNGTTVTISKPGISNVDKASATVDGSSDNFIVRITETAEATAAVERALTKEYGSLENIRYFPMDISLYDSTGTTRIADTTGLTVNITIPIPDDLITYAGNNKAGAVVGEDNLEKLNATFKTIDGVPCVSFKATHFSPYTIYVDTQNLTAGMDSSPKTGDGIHPKWFLAIGLACLSVVLFMKRDNKNIRTA